jgi:hypothetical protein
MNKEGYIYNMGDLIKGLFIGLIIGGVFVYLVMSGTIDISSILATKPSPAP